MDLGFWEAWADVFGSKKMMTTWLKKFRPTTGKRRGGNNLERLRGAYYSVELNRDVVRRCKLTSA